MKKNKNIKVLYIAGNGHSGSTLLDIVIGSNPSIFSAGELGFITRPSIWEEICSCGTKISECTLWTGIIKRWEKKVDISIQEFRHLRSYYERNKATIRVLKNHFFPSPKFVKYCKATLALFEAIQEETGKNVIVDSTKLPQRIIVLRKIVDLKVIHICRDAKGVLNSAKKFVKKDLSAGVEVNVFPKKTWWILLNWTLTNFLTTMFCIKNAWVRIKYKNFVKDPTSLKIIDDMVQGQEDEVYKTQHMLAGNAIRLKKEIKIDPNLGFEYSRLTKRQKKVAGFIDKMFPCWA